MQRPRKRAYQDFKFQRSTESTLNSILGISPKHSTRSCRNRSSANASLSQNLVPPMFPSSRYISTNYFTPKLSSHRNSAEQRPKKMHSRTSSVTNQCSINSVEMRAPTFSFLTVTPKQMSTSIEKFFPTRNKSQQLFYVDESSKLDECSSPVYKAHCNEPSEKLRKSSQRLKIEDSGYENFKIEGW